MPAHGWETAAACATADPDAWFPRRGGDGGAGAKRICNERCPVRRQCLDAALADEDGRGAKDRHGIRGGLGPRQRARLAKRQSAAQPQPTG
ncbi:WhiB family transcriptional regulator [Streptomyces sp. 4N509B]|uniref:WhiB family transcriptional regulator n=1 Tax=Streptomyces sp. 4N509B TaxID=3457413 RepID=UPI003FD29186